MTITAKIVAHSKSPQGVEIVTYELEYPRFIHSEVLTHRVFSRNAASSRAIPVKRQLELIYDNMAAPTHWGKNQAGMQAESELNFWDADTAARVWRKAGQDVLIRAAELNELGLHKQATNRMVEPWSHIKVVVTATEWANWFYLRDHEDAQPEIRQLAQEMSKAYDDSKAKPLLEGEWHMPYFEDGFWGPDFETSLDDALAVSSSCCAQVSYRKLDDSLEKARMIFDKLITSKPEHASPMEHQATPIRKIGMDEVWQDIEGVTHIDRRNQLWSGNFLGWVQHRQIL